MNVSLPEPGMACPPLTAFSILMLIKQDVVDPPSQTGTLTLMRATFEIPDDLYHEVQTEAAREGRTLEEVTISLFERWLRERVEPTLANPEADDVDWESFQAPLAPFIHSEGKLTHLEVMKKERDEDWKAEARSKISQGMDSIREGRTIQAELVKAEMAEFKER